MSRRTAFSAQALAVLAALADRGIVQACWEEDEPAGRPKRHLYRLTSDGLASATVALAAAPASAVRPARPGRAGAPQRLALEDS